MTTEREALARIAALCDGADAAKDRRYRSLLHTAAVRPILAEAPPEAGDDVRSATIDRDALLDIVLDEDMADAILALVRPVQPPHPS